MLSLHKFSCLMKHKKFPLKKSIIDELFPKPELDFLFFKTNSRAKTENVFTLIAFTDH